MSCFVAPKSARSAYNFFVAAERKRIKDKEENKELKSTDLMRLCGEAWKALGPDDKKVISCASSVFWTPTVLCFFLFALTVCLVRVRTPVTAAEKRW